MKIAARNYLNKDITRLLVRNITAVIVSLACLAWPASDSHAGSTNITNVQTNLQNALGSGKAGLNSQTVINNLKNAPDKKHRRSRKTGQQTVNPSLVGQTIIQSISQSKVNRANNPGKQSAFKKFKKLQNNALKGKNNNSADVRYNKDNNTPAFIKPTGRGMHITSDISSLDNTSLTEKGKQFMKNNRELLKLDDPDKEMRLKRVKREGNGKAHIRYQQTYQGIPVWAGEVMLHTTPEGELYLFQGRYYPTPRAFGSVKPAVNEKAARKAVRLDLRLDDTVTETSDPELVIFPHKKGKFSLAYKIEIAPTMDERWLYFIDARSGKVIHRINQIHDAGTIVSASSSDVLGDTRNFNAWLETGTFYLIDPSTPTQDPSYDPLNIGPNSTGDSFVYDARNGDNSLPQDLITSSASNSGWDPAGVSAAANVRKAYDYFKQTMNRDSFDNNGKNLLTTIHYASWDQEKLAYNYNQAFWNGTWMVFGDGDGIVFNQLAGCLDVVAHEMTHGVIQNSANLIYENQSGALNESFADIFGAMVDRDDWLMGEDCTVVSPGYIRNMSNPALGLPSQPTKMSEYQNLPNTEDEDNGGVHINSGIPNRAAYLLAEGLTLEGLGTSIGKAKMEQIFYRALTTYLLRQSNFLDARWATIQSADDLYGAGSAESEAVAAAWDAVEVIEIGVPDDTTPTSTDPVYGEQLMVYLYQNPVLLQNELYVQIMPEPFTGYDPALDYGPWNGLSYASLTRPAALTDEFGTYLLYVGIDNNLYLIDIAAASESQITDTGNVFSIAASTDFRYFAFTSTSGTDNNIYVVDLVDDTSAAYPLQPPIIDGAGSNTNRIIFADALDFDSTSRTIVFDALNCTSTPVLGDCAAGGGYKYWSVGFLNAADGTQSYPFAGLNPQIELGFPSFAANNNFVIALDVENFTNYSIDNSIYSSVLTVNFQNQAVGLVKDYGLNYFSPFLGVPSFWGGDDYVTMQMPFGERTTAHRIAIDTNWTGVDSSVSINDYSVAMPIMHIAGVPNISATLSASTNNLNFGSVSVGQSKTLTVTISNTGGRDINITDINLTGSGYTHNATNTLLPRNSSMDVKVTFTAGATTGEQLGTLNFLSDGVPSPLSVSLNATVIPMWPNLVPYKPEGWDAPIVVSSQLGTNSNNTIYTTDNIYIDWAVANASSINIIETHYTNLYVDDVFVTGWFSTEMNAWVYSFVEDYNLGMLSAGEHEIKIIADSTELVVESNEQDNIYTKIITVLPSDDSCPNDPSKTDPGICGCGVADTDSDSDGTADCNDLCVNDPSKTDPGICGCGVADTDSDGDGIADCIDTDVDGDGFTNIEETQCGSDPINPESKCRRGLPFLMLLLD